MKTAIAPNEIEPLLKGSPTVSTIPPVSAAPAANKGTDNLRIKQVKAVVTEIKKKRKGKPEITIWEVRVGSAISKIYFTPSGDRELFTLGSAAMRNVPRSPPVERWASSIRQ